MRFEEALKAMREGKIVKSPITSGDLQINDSNRIIVYHYDYGFVPYEFSDIEILAEDWEIVEDD